MAADGAGWPRCDSPSSCKLIQWPVTPLLRARDAQQSHNAPRQRNPQKLHRAVGPGEEGVGHFRHSMVRYHRVGVARRVRGWASARAKRIVGKGWFAGFPWCHYFWACRIVAWPHQPLTLIPFPLSPKTKGCNKRIYLLTAYWEALSIWREWARC